MCLEMLGETGLICWIGQTRDKESKKTIENLLACHWTFHTWCIVRCWQLRPHCWRTTESSCWQALSCTRQRLFAQSLCGATYVWNLLTADNILAYLVHTKHFFEKQLQLRRKTLHVFHSSQGLLMYLRECKPVNVALQSFATDSKMIGANKRCSEWDAKTIEANGVPYYTLVGLTPWEVALTGANDAIAQHDPRITPGS